MTTSVGIRELRDNISAILRRVKAGETLELTDRGRVFAKVVPLSSPQAPTLSDRLRELSARGVVEWSGLAPSVDEDAWSRLPMEGRHGEAAVRWARGQGEDAESAG